MASGEKNIYFADYEYIKLTWVTSNPSADNGGSSLLQWAAVYMVNISAGGDSRTLDIDYTMTIGDETITGTKRVTKSGDLVAGGSVTLNHNFVPAPTIAGNFRAVVKGYNYSEAFEKTVSSNLQIKPDRINIAAQVNCSTANIGDTPVITITQPSVSPSYTKRYTLTYTFGSHGATIFENETATAYTGFTIPQSFYAEIPNAKSGVMVLSLETYNGGDYLGISHTEVTINANEYTSKPTIFPRIKDTNAATIALTGDENTLVRYMSNAYIDMGAEARNYATIASQICANGGKAITTATGTINGVEQAKFTCSVTDSRGYTTTISMTKPLVEYIKLTCNLGESLPDTSGKMRVECSGSYWDGDFGIASNTLSVQYRYKESGGEWSAWAYMATSVRSNSYTANADLTGLDYRKKYTFQARAIDRLSTVTTGEADKVALPVFHWSESDFVFEVPVEFKQGAAGIETEASESSSGTWTPRLNTTSAVKYYDVQSGWYMRVGNVVTIGFNIKAECNSEHNTVAISITDLPFKPAENAFGGGVMFGAYVNAGFCFEAWAATTSGTITPRVQPCNNTTAGNLNIASTACYPSGENSVTLGGTITYKTNE